MKRDINSTVTIKPGVQMPSFGLGLYKSQPGDETYNAVRYALDYGYKLVDTAAFYNNEESTGKAIKDSGVGRENVFVTSKVWVTDLNNVEAALDSTLSKLGTDYLDLYLIHWPGTDDDVRHRAWETMLNQAAKGKIKACGVSNFYVKHLETMKEKGLELPANNQIELHPWCQRRDVVKFCKENGISVTAWGPIFHGHLSEEPLAEEIGEKHGKSAAQATLRWHVQHDINIIPKSVNKERIEQNAQIFDFKLDAEDMAALDALDGKGEFAFSPFIFNGDLDSARSTRK